MGDMNEYRAEIDRIDAALIELLKERLQVVRKVGEYKAARGLPVFDAVREAEKLERVRAMAGDAAEAGRLAVIFQCIMDVAKDAEREEK